MTNFGRLILFLVTKKSEKIQMSRRSLQIDNKIKRSHKSSFFDISKADDVIDEPDKTEEVKNEPDSVKKDKRFKKGTYIAVTVIAVLLVAAIVVSGIDFFIDGELNGIFKKDEKPTYYKIYTPDWETDIYTVQEYLDLDPDFMTYKYGITEEGYRPGNIRSDTEIGFFYNYFTAIKQGDHEKLNSFFTKEYLDKNGKFSDFPMQKIYNIEIIKQPKTETLNEKYKNSYDYGVYAVRYNIYRNDGLFCAEVDETHAREEGIIVVFESAGVGKIVERMDAKYLI